jgi:hypothetical protein
MCAVQLVTKISNLIILSLYGAALGDVKEFLRRLHATLKYLYSPESEFIICRDKNYLNENNLKKQVNSVLKT